MDFLKRSMKDRKFVFSIVILVPLIFVILLGPQLASDDPLAMNTSSALAPSSSQCPLGADGYGRCILSYLLVGVRLSMTVALFGTLGVSTTGLLLGIFTGYLGGKIGGAIMRAASVALCFPLILFAMVIVGLWGTGVRNLTMVVVILYMPHFTRITYSSTTRVRRMEFVEDGISTGVTLNRVLFGIILSNVFSPPAIRISPTALSTTSLESGLSFLGLDVQSPGPPRGQMIGDARSSLSVDVTYTVWPSLFLSLTILTTNLMGDTLRDIFNPKLRDSF